MTEDELFSLIQIHTSCFFSELLNNAQSALSNTLVETMPGQKWGKARRIEYIY